MSTLNHHSLLNITLNKIAEKEKLSGRKKDHVIEQSHNIFDKRMVKNALSRNTSLTVAERLNMYRTYENVVKYNKEALVVEQEMICSKLSIAKPPIGLQNNSANKNLMIIKSSISGGAGLQRKAGFRETTPNKQTDNKLLDRSSLAPALPTLSTMKSFHCRETSIKRDSSFLGSSFNDSSFVKPKRALPKTPIKLKTAEEELNISVPTKMPSIRRSNLKFYPNTFSKFVIHKKNRLSMTKIDSAPAATKINRIGDQPLYVNKENQ